MRRSVSGVRRLGLRPGGVGLTEVCLGRRCLASQRSVPVPQSSNRGQRFYEKEVVAESLVPSDYNKRAPRFWKKREPEMVWLLMGEGSREEQREKLAYILDRMGHLRPEGRRERLGVLAKLRDLQAILDPQLTKALLERLTESVPSESEALRLADEDLGGEVSELTRQLLPLLRLSLALVRLPDAPPAVFLAHRQLLRLVWLRSADLRPSEVLHFIADFALPLRTVHRARLPTELLPEALHQRVLDFLLAPESRSLSVKERAFLFHALLDIQHAVGEKERFALAKKTLPLKAEVQEALLKVLVDREDPDDPEKAPEDKDALLEEKSTLTITLVKMLTSYKGALQELRKNAEFVESLRSLLVLELLQSDGSMNMQALTRLVRMADVLHVMGTDTLCTRLANRLILRQMEVRDAKGQWALRLKDLEGLHSWMRRSLFPLAERAPAAQDALLRRVLNPGDVQVREFPSQAVRVVAGLLADDPPRFTAAVRSLELQDQLADFLDGFYQKGRLRELDKRAKALLFQLDCLLGMTEARQLNAPRMPQSALESLGLRTAGDLADVWPSRRPLVRVAQTLECKREAGTLSKGWLLRDFQPFPYSAKVIALLHRSKDKIVSLSTLKRVETLRDLGVPKGRLVVALYPLEVWERRDGKALEPSPAAQHEMAWLAQLGFRVRPFALLGSDAQRKEVRDYKPDIPASLADAV